MSAPIAIVEAPSILGLRPTGVEELPDALREAGLYERLGIRDVVRVSSLAYDDRRNAETGFLNPDTLVEFTHRLADELGRVLDRGHRPLVLGGDWTFDGRCPLIADDDVVAIGMRDGDEARSYGSQSLPAGMLSCDLAAVRRLTPPRVIDAAIDHLRDRSVAGAWIHFDVDVLSDEVMPAVDYRLPDGLSWSEAEIMLARAWSCGAAGMDVTIFNPRLDRDGSIARSLAGMIGNALGPEGSGYSRSLQ